MHLQVKKDHRTIQRKIPSDISQFIYQLVGPTVIRTINRNGHRLLPFIKTKFQKVTNKTIHSYISISIDKYDVNIYC